MESGTTPSRRGSDCSTYFLTAPKEHLDIALIALSAMFREMRNDAGHPTGKSLCREAAYANLVVFPVYLKKVYELIKWLRCNRLT
jgi:hypothetical protein